MQDARVQPHPGPLHFDEYRNQRHFHVGEQIAQSLGVQRRLEVPPQPQRAVRVGGRVGRSVGDFNLVESLLPRPLPDQVGDLGHLPTQYRQGQRLQSQPVVSQQVRRNHRVVVHHPVWVDAVVAQQSQIVVGIVR